MLAAKLRFPELTLVVERAAVQDLIQHIEKMRRCECSSIIAKLTPVPGLASTGSVELVASGESEVDEYMRSKNRLTLTLSPEAIELLLVKLHEFERFGSSSTPEFQEFYAAGDRAGRRKTLRVFLSLD